MIEYRNMSDNELMMAETNAKEILTHVNNNYYTRYANVTVEQREEALNALHEIRIEMWTRGYGAVPTAEKLPDAIRNLSRAEAKLEAAIADGNEVKIYAAKNRVNENRDRIAFINA